MHVGQEGGIRTCDLLRGVDQKARWCTCAAAELMIRPQYLGGRVAHALRLFSCICCIRSGHKEGQRTV